MSQVATNPRTASRSKAGSSNANAVDQRETLLDYVRQAARTMRRNELGYALLLWLTIVIATIITMVLVDHWLWSLNKLARLAVFVGLLGWTAWWIPRRVLPPLLHTVNVEHAARTIEKQFPECKDSLISWLQLSDESSKAPRGVVAYVGRYAIRNLNGQDSQSVVDSASVVRLGAAFFGCLLCLGIYMFASPKSGMTTIARLALPWADIAPAARVRVLEVLPGSTTVTQGSVLPISVTIRGMHQGEGVSVRFDLSDGQLVGETLPMVPEIERINYKLDLGKTFGGIHQPLKYWILAGDAVSGPYDVGVQVVPLVAVERTELTFPAYTKLKPRTLLQQGSFEAPEGTRVKVFATTNQAMKKARLEFDPVVDGKVFHSARDLVDMKIDQQQVTGDWVALLDEKRSSPTITNYRIRVTNELGESNPDPILYPTKVIADLAPEVSIDADVPAVIDVPLHGSFVIEARANDPDYGLTQLGFIASAAKGVDPNQRTELFREVGFESQEGTLGQTSRTIAIKPHERELKVGSEFEVIAFALDNRHSPTSGSPEPNRSTSTPVRIRIVDDPQPVEQEPSQASEPKQADAPKPPTERQRWEITPDHRNEDTSKSTSNKSSTNSSGDENASPSSSNDGAGGSSESNGSSPSQSSGNGSGKGSSDNAQQKPAQNPNNGQGSGEGSSGEQNASPDSSRNSEGSSNNSSSSRASEPSSSSMRSQGKPSAKPPTHDGDTIERINQFIQEKENPSQQDSANQSSGDDDPQAPNASSRPPRPENNATQQDPNPGEQADGKTPKDPTDDGKSSDGKSSDGKSADGKSADGKSADGKSADGKSADGKSADGKSADGKSADGKSADGKSADGKSADGKSADGKSADGKSADGKSADGKSADGKSADGKSADGKPADGKSADGKSADGKSADGKSADGKSADGKSADGKSADGKSADGKSADGKSADGKSADGKSADGKSADGKSADGKSADGKSADGKSADGKSADGKSADGKSADGKSADGKPADGKSADGKSADGKSADGKPADGKSADGKSADGKSADGKSADGKSADGKSADGKSAVGKPVDGESADGKSTDGKSADGKSADGKSADGKSADGKSADGKSADGKSDNGKSGDGKQSSDGKSNGSESKDGSSNGSGSEASNGSQSGTANSKSNSGDSQSGNGSPSGDPAKEGGMAGGGVNQGTTPKNGSGSGSAGTSTKTAVDKANLEYAEKTTDLVLDYIERQRDQPDPELLRRLGWTPDDLRKFADRWKAAKEQSRLTPEKKSEYEATLKSLGLRHGDRRPDALQDRNDTIQGLQEEGMRLRPPESLREQFEAFRKAAGNLNKSP